MFLAGCLWGQGKSDNIFTLTGRVWAQNILETFTVKGAVVQVISDTSKFSTSTDRNGYYKIEVPVNQKDGDYSVMVTWNDPVLKRVYSQKKLLVPGKESHKYKQNFFIKNFGYKNKK